jgi:hypothetical protein
MSMTNYITDALLNYLFRASSFTPDSTFYVGLSTTLIDETGVVSEPSGGQYARQPITRASASWTDPASVHYITNSTVINFPESTASWGTIKAIFLANASTSGSVLYFDNLDSFIPVGPSTKVTISAGKLKVEGN